MTNNKNLNSVFKDISFWNHLTDDQKRLLTENTTIIKAKKNSELTSIDYNCAGLLFVKSGSIRIYILSEDGKEITLYRVPKGEICVLSASCALNSITFDIHISVMEDSEIIQVESDVIESIMNENIHFELFAYKISAERFSDVMWTIQQVLFLSFDKRLAIFLIDESVNKKSDLLKITHEEIAKYLGSAREVVSRMLKYFASENLVELSRGRIKIIDKKGLLSLTQN